MSERERWIVYPLLFLALGAALRDKLLKQTRAKQIVCEQVHLVDPEGRELARLNGAGLTFELGGVGNGLIRANAIDGQSLFERGKPVVTRTPQQTPAFRVPFQEFLRMFPQFQSALPKESGLSKDVPVGPPAGKTEAPPTGVQPGASPPAQGPALQPPAVEPTEGV